MDLLGFLMVKLNIKYYLIMGFLIRFYEKIYKKQSLEKTKTLRKC